MNDSAQPTEMLSPEGVLELCAYTRFPERLKLIDPRLAEFEKEDEFGVLDRLKVIETVCGSDLGRLIDLGGNSGFFALSLLDAGRATHARVIDLDKGALAAGRYMATAMHLSPNIEFLDQEVTLDYISRLPTFDTVMCLNLIHHAGALFDVELVERQGWDEYAQRWMRELRQKCRTAIVGVGLKGFKPVNWHVPKPARLHRFMEIVEGAGWSVRYDANVDDIRKFGVEAADGRRRAASERAAQPIWKDPFRPLAAVRRRLSGAPKESKLSKYHLFVLE